MNNQFYMSDFYCTKCGNLSMSLPRAKKKQREAGHLKNLYCPHCREEHNHVEMRPFGAYRLEDFRFEFENGNFDTDGNRKNPYGQFKMIVRKENTNA